MGSNSQKVTNVSDIVLPNLFHILKAFSVCCFSFLCSNCFRRTGFRKSSGVSVSDSLRIGHVFWNRTSDRIESQNARSRQRYFKPDHDADVDWIRRILFERAIPGCYAALSQGASVDPLGRRPARRDAGRTNASWNVAGTCDSCRLGARVVRTGTAIFSLVIDISSNRG